MNPPDADLLSLLDLYDTDTAYQAWYECQYFKEHHRLPADARVIEYVIVNADSSYIFVHRDLKAGIQ